MLPVTVPTPDDLEASAGVGEAFRRVRGRGGLPLEFEIGQGDAAVEILERSSALPSDLIVMGTHGRHGFDRLVLGSVTEKVIRKARCPVMTVPPGTAEAVPASPLFKRILCAIDFSDASLKALDHAMSLAEEADAHLTLAHVVEVTPAPQFTVRGVSRIEKPRCLCGSSRAGPGRAVAACRSPRRACVLHGGYDAGHRQGLSRDSADRV